MICVEVPVGTLRSQFTALIELGQMAPTPEVEAFIAGAMTAISWMSDGEPLPSAVAAKMMQVGQVSH